VLGGDHADRLATESHASAIADMPRGHEVLGLYPELIGIRGAGRRPFSPNAGDGAGQTVIPIGGQVLVIHVQGFVRPK
jgi:hypothetical protein